MQPAYRNTVTAVATTLALAFASLLLAALVFLSVRDLGEPPVSLVLLGVGSLLIGEWIAQHDGRMLATVAAIILGATVALIVAPEVGGRFDSKVDELFSMDRLHFGAVTLAISGGAIGSIVTRLHGSLKRCEVQVAISDSKEAEGQTRRSS